MEPKNIILPQDRMPLQRYNILSDIKLNPPLGPDSNPIKPEDLAPVFPMNLIEQEVSTQRWIDIPEPVLDALRIWRPSPLTRASRFEKALGTPARIYFKNESVSPPGSHKPNTAVPQAYYNKVFGIERITTETGAGQWGSALACVMEEAIKAREEGKEKTIVVTFSGHGLLDLGAYDRYLSGELTDVGMSETQLAEALGAVKGYPRPAHLKSR